MKRVTIKDVARKAGVSRATIDRVIYNRGYVSEEKKKAVLKAIRELNFTPNRAAQALAVRKKRSIAVVYPGGEKYFWNEVENGIDAAAREFESSGLSVVKYRTDKFDVGEQQKILQRIMADGLDGVAVAPAHAAKLNSLIGKLGTRKIPVVTFNHDAPKSVRLSYVGQDLVRSGVLAADLMALFLQKKGTVVILRHRTGVVERETGFTKRMEQEYPGVRIIERFDCRHSEGKAYTIARELCRKNRNPDGLFVTNAYVFMVGRALQEAHMENKVAVVGFDMTEETDHLIRNGVIDAVITQEPYRQGYEPVRILHDFLYRDAIPDHPILYTKSEIILRGNV
jgi:LacI family transcriptional regulator